MDANIFYELYRQREAELERHLERRLGVGLRPEAVVPRRGILRALRALRSARRGRIGSPAEVLR
ncbi:hypothetical protein GCM10023169_07120 [Georgenia halophila]|uniref:PIN domain-containing protein n=2 Tax=Georgenia halophila TaxID=620889 RepID=A0ABP8KX82_9MICO